MRDAVIVATSRTAVGKAIKGTTRYERSDEMMASVIRDLMQQTDGKIDPLELDDVIIGCAMPEGSQGLNFARPIVIRAGLPVEVPAQTVNRFCASGLQSIASAAERVVANSADLILAGGAETMSLVPMSGFRLSPNPALIDENPEVYMSMGLTAENVADKWHVTREAQDAFAYRSHQRAAAATDAGKFREEIIPVQVTDCGIDANGRPYEKTVTFDTDEHLRRETSLAGLAKLQPVFRPDGSVTAGNSSPLSDGAAGVLVMEADMAAKAGLTPLARFVGFSVAGVPPEYMGIGPVKAIPKVLARAGLTLADIDLIELNEAFAAQALAVCNELGLDQEKVNVNGGALALGHPLGCTGSKLTVQLIHEMHRRHSKYGIVTMCVGGGQGAAAIFENLQN